MAWKPGESGNPAGRKPGTGEVARLRAAIRDDVEDVLKAMVKAAKEGDSQAARLLLERVIPALRPIDSPVPLALDISNLMVSGQAIFDAVGREDITPVQARELLQGLVGITKIRELDELASRIEALEQLVASKKQ